MLCEIWSRLWPTTVLRIHPHLHLFCLLFQCLLVNLQLLRYLWAWLSLQNLFQFHVQLLLLLNQQFLLHHLNGIKRCQLVRSSSCLTSSVFTMSLLWSVCIFWIISYVLGSLPSNFLQRWMFIGFSSSSSNALHLVRSLSNSRWMWYNSRLTVAQKVVKISVMTVLIYLRSSTFATLLDSMFFSLLIFLISILRMRMSSSLWVYCVSPLSSVDWWILIFSWSKASSSFLRTSWVPRMFLSLIT